jgi:very-short-patch-repair endonuclease
MTSDFARFDEIRERYARLLPEWDSHYRATGHMRHDPYVMDWSMSPIEARVWADIRDDGLPFYPQLPVLTYFLDFGCPMLKIGIECDGKAWHDNRRDSFRDRALAEAGWTIFRLEGHECKRSLEDPRFREADELDAEHVTKWFLTTAQGILHAINVMHLQDEFTAFDAAYEGTIASTLCEHNATPRVRTPGRIPPVQSNPVLASELMDDFFQDMHRRMINAA